MRVRLLKSKIHRATVTDAQLDYPGSITIDEDLMDAAGIYAYEQVLVADLTNGTRHETYVVPGARGKREICVMGAAAHLAKMGDKVIIMAYAEVKEKDITKHKPKIIVVDDNNKVIKST